MAGGLPADRLRSGLRQLPGPGLDPGRVDRLLAYLSLLQHWNTAYNLTAVRRVEDMVTLHLLDALSVLPWIPPGRLLDAGSGAGLPGIPLAIARSGLEVTLLDSAGKKVRFLNHVKRELGLPNVTPVQDRLESFEPQAAFDAVISRAFASLSDFARAARHLARGVPLLAMKGRLPREELENLPEWLHIDRIEPLVVPGLHQERHLVIMSSNP